MKRILLPIIALLATLSVTAQSTIVLTGEKKGDTHVMVSNVQVAFAENRTMLSLDFILDSLQVSSNRYRAFTPVIVSKNDSTQRQRMKTFIVSGRTQDIVFERDGIDPFYADNCVKVRRYNDTPQTYNYTDGVDRQPWHRNADIYVEGYYSGFKSNSALSFVVIMDTLDAILSGKEVSDESLLMSGNPKIWNILSNSKCWADINDEWQSSKIV